MVRYPRNESSSREHQPVSGVRGVAWLFDCEDFTVGALGRARMIEGRRKSYAQITSTS